MAVFWSLGAGSGHKKAEGSWDATASVQSASEAGVELIGNASATWFITGVQLEVGQNATEFEHEPFERTLAKCQRYYKKYDVGSDTAYSRLVVSTYADTTSRFYVTMQLPVELRTTWFDYGTK